MDGNIFLPGGTKQFEFLRKNLDCSNKSVLIAGAGAEVIALWIKGMGAEKTYLITDDYDSFISSKLNLKGSSDVNAAMMDYDNTDFGKGEFDIIYAQASISGKRRGKTLKEFSRILKPEGHICLGEITSLYQNAPPFVKNLWDSSNLNPLYEADLEKFYGERKFEVVSAENISNELYEFYRHSKRLVESRLPNLNEDEKKYYKKLINKFNHESNAFLKLGADKYMGMTVMLLKKRGDEERG